MLPSETIELAIYKFVESVRPLPANVTIQQLSNIIGESDHVRIVERLTDLDANGRLLLSKYLAGQKLPFARFEPNAFFYSDSFMMAVAPGGRKHFEELERKPTQDNQGEDKSVTAEKLSRPTDVLQIFVSHSSKDKILAEALTDLLKSALGLLPAQIRCSSVDGHRLPVEVNTESKLRQEVNAAPVVIGLVTPTSLSSSYVMFELGARWGADLFLAPLLAGVSPGGLSGPLSLLNALSANHENQIHQLLYDISRELGTGLQSTSSYLKHVSAVKTIADGISVETAVSSRPTPEIKQVGAVNYYFVGEKGPYCQPCYDEKDKLIVLTPQQEWNGGIRRKCEVCNKYFYEKQMELSQKSIKPFMR